MVNLRTLAECYAEQRKQLDTYMDLYHASARKNGEVAKKTVYYAQLCANAASRMKFWENHPPVKR